MFDNDCLNPKAISAGHAGRPQQKQELIACEKKKIQPFGIIPLSSCDEQVKQYVAKVSVSVTQEIGGVGCMTLHL